MRNGLTMVNTKLQDPPSDAVLTALVDRVEARLLASTAATTRRKRPLAIIGAIGAGVLVFGAGFAVAAAALPNLSAPDYGTTLSGSGGTVPALFSIGCYDSTSSSSSAMTWTENTEADANLARTDPAAECATMHIMITIHQALLAESAKLVAAGATCGTIVLTGETAQTVKFVADGSGGTTFTNSATGPSCGKTVDLALPATPESPSAVCTVSPNVAAVYPLHGRSASDICESLGEDVWSS
jgi:hypothetical protein